MVEYQSYPDPEGPSLSDPERKKDIFAGRTIRLGNPCIYNIRIIASSV